MTRILKAREIERLENTSFASVLGGVPAAAQVDASQQTCQTCGGSECGTCQTGCSLTCASCNIACLTASLTGTCGGSCGGTCGSECGTCGTECGSCAVTCDGCMLDQAAAPAAPEPAVVATGRVLRVPTPDGWRL